MRLKLFLIVALAAGLFPLVRADARPHSHGPWRHTRWHASSYRHHPYLQRHGPHFRTSFYFGPSAYYGVGYDPYFPSYGYYDYYNEPAYTVARPNRAANGLLLGALAGAVIGNNSGDLHHSAWRGAALGAASGYILGSIADSRAERREAAVANSAPPPPTAAPLVVADDPPAPAPASTPKPAPPPARPTSPMADANRLFGR